MTSAPYAAWILDPGFQVRVAPAKAHGAAVTLDVDLFLQEAHHGILGFRCKLRGARILDPEDVARILDDHDLHAQADPEVGDLSFPCVLRRPDHPLYPAQPEAAGHQDPVAFGKRLGEVPPVLQLLAFELHQLHPGAVGDTPVKEGLEDRDVRVVQPGVLPHDGHAHRLLCLGKVLHDLSPSVAGRTLFSEAQLLDDDLVHFLLDEGQGDLVDGGPHIVGGDHGLFLHVREERDLAAQVFVQRARGTAQEDVRLDPDLPQLPHRVLGGLALGLSPVDLRHQGEVDEQHVLLAEIVDELPCRFQERHALDIAHRSPDLHDGEIHAGLLADAEDAGLDLVRDMGDDLNGPAEESSLPLLRDDRLVDLARW